MNAKWMGVVFLGTIGAGLGLSGSAVAAFEVDSYTIDGGGGRSAGATFIVVGTIGQPDADPLQPSVSDNVQFSVTGGFWASPAATTSGIFRNGFE